MLDSFGAVGVRDDEIEPVAVDELSNFAPEMTSLFGVKPDHRVSPRDRIEARSDGAGSLLRDDPGARAGPSAVGADLQGKARIVLILPVAVLTRNGTPAAQDCGGRERASHQSLLAVDVQRRRALGLVENLRRQLDWSDHLREGAKPQDPAAQRPVVRDRQLEDQAAVGPFLNRL